MGSTLASKPIPGSPRIERMTIADLQQIARGYLALSDEVKSLIHIAVSATHDHKKRKS